MWNNTPDTLLLQARWYEPSGKTSGWLLVCQVTIQFWNSGLTELCLDLCLSGPIKIAQHMYHCTARLIWRIRASLHSKLIIFVRKQNQMTDSSSYVENNKVFCTLFVVVFFCDVRWSIEAGRPSMLTAANQKHHNRSGQMCSARFCQIEDIILNISIILSLSDLTVDVRGKRAMSHTEHNLT